MDKQLCLGLVLGMLGGALLVANVPKAKQLIDKGQKTVMKKVKNIFNGSGGDDDSAESSDESPEGEAISGEDKKKALSKRVKKHA